MTARVNLVLDLGITTAFLVVSNPSLTGMAVHEWLGVSFAVAMLTHVLFHWDWAVGVTTSLFGRLKQGVRLNYLVDVVLFVAFTAAVLSGIMISKHILPLLGLHPSPARGWRGIHDLASNVAVFAVAVHVGLHWTWVATQLKQLVGRTEGRRRETSLPPLDNGAPV